MNKSRLQTSMNEREKVFCEAVKMYRGIGYGRMKDLITGIWAQELMDDGASEKTALLGALDLATWLKQSVLNNENGHGQVPDAKGILKIIGGIIISPVYLPYVIVKEKLKKRKENGK